MPFDKSGALDRTQKGGKPLTEQEKAELKKQFDVKNMSEEQSIQLLGDLYRDGVVSADTLWQGITRLCAHQLNQSGSSDASAAGSSGNSAPQNISPTQKANMLDY